MCSNQGLGAAPEKKVMNVVMHFDARNTTDIFSDIWNNIVEKDKWQRGLGMWVYPSPLKTAGDIATTSISVIKAQARTASPSIIYGCYKSARNWIFQWVHADNQWKAQVVLCPGHLHSKDPMQIVRN